MLDAAKRRRGSSAGSDSAESASSLLSSSGGYRGTWPWPGRVCGTVVLAASKHTDPDNVFTETILGHLCIESVAAVANSKAHLGGSVAQMCAELADWLDPESTAKMVHEAIRTIHRGFKLQLERLQVMLDDLESDAIAGLEKGKQSAGEKAVQSSLWSRNTIWRLSRC